MFSLGAFSAGHQHLDFANVLGPSSSTIGRHVVTASDFTLGGDDGVLIVLLQLAAAVAELADGTRDTERLQATRMQVGQTVSMQDRIDAYIVARKIEPGTTFWQ